MVMDTRTRVARPLFSPGMRPSNVADTMPSVSPDGKRFLFIRREPAAIPTHINIVFNWTEELKQ